MKPGPATAILLSGMVTSLSFGVLGVAGCTFVSEKCEECSCEQDAGTAGQGGGGSQPAPVDSGEPDPGSSTGTKAEGELCDAGSECQAGLSCLSTDVGMPDICARSCETDADCGWEGEVCFSYSTRPRDAHCSKAEPAEYGRCGIARTTHCAEPMFCLQIQDLWLGYCLTDCIIASGGDGECLPEQACITGVLSSTTIGVCGDRAARGEVCDLRVGLGCFPEDNCSPDLADPAAEFSCLPACSESDQVCADGAECVSWLPGDPTGSSCYL